MNQQPLTVDSSEICKRNNNNKKNQSKDPAKIAVFVKMPLLQSNSNSLKMLLACSLCCHQSTHTASRAFPS